MSITITTAQHEQLTLVHERIVAFDKECEEREHTDVGDAWDILNHAEGVLSSVLGAK